MLETLCGEFRPNVGCLGHREEERKCLKLIKSRVQSRPQEITDKSSAYVKGTRIG